MIDMTDILNIIRTAIYGKDMRQAIHDGFKRLGDGLNAEEKARIEEDNKLRAAIEEETRNRISEDDKLRSAIEDEKRNRISEDDKLRAAIEDEKRDRISEDDKLRSSINTVSNNCQNNYSYLSSLIQSEVEARKKAIESLMAQINGILSSTGMTIYDGGPFRSSSFDSFLDGGLFAEIASNTVDCGGFGDLSIQTEEKTVFDGGVY